MNAWDHQDCYLFHLFHAWPATRWVVERERCTNLFVHEDVDDGVEDSAAFGQQGGHHAKHRSDESRPSKCCCHGNHTIWHPANQIAHHSGDDHEQNVVLSPSGCRLPEPPNLRQKQQNHSQTLENKGSPMILGFDMVLGKKIWRMFTLFWILEGFA